MEDAQAALVALPRFQHDFASRLAEPGVELRIAVFYWVCRAIKVRCSSNRHAKDSLHNFFLRSCPVLGCAACTVGRQVWRITQRLQSPREVDGG
jgi:hypothetical protein